MCRSATIQGRSPSGSRPPPRPPAARQAGVELGELRCDRRERLGNGLGAGLRALASTDLLVLGQPGGRRRGQLGLLGEPGRLGQRAAGRRCLEANARQALDSGHEDRCAVQQRGARGAVAGGSEMDAPRERPRDRRACDQRPRAEQHELPVGQAVQLLHHAARDHALVGAQLDDDRVRLGGRREQRRVDAGRQQPVVAREPLLRRRPCRLGQRDERIEAGQELLALRPGGRIAEPVR